MQPGHPNLVGGGKRPFHTIIPAFLTRDGKPVMSFGVMGADMQPQGHLQMMVRLIDYGQNPQAAADGPRWKITLDGQIALEQAIAEVAAELAQLRSSRSSRERWNMEFGAAQLIYRLGDGYRRRVGAAPRRSGGWLLKRNVTWSHLWLRFAVATPGCSRRPCVARADHGDYPSKPIRLIVPFPAGGTADMLARLIGAEAFRKARAASHHRQSSGAGGNIGADLVAKAPADGYTLLLGAVATHAINPSLYPHMPYDPVKDFAPISCWSPCPTCWWSIPSLPVHSVTELIALAKAKPGQARLCVGRQRYHSCICRASCSRTWPAWT